MAAHPTTVKAVRAPVPATTGISDLTIARIRIGSSTRRSRAQCRRGRSTATTDARGASTHSAASSSIAELANEAEIELVPHGSGVYSYHFCATRPQTPFGEFAFLDPEGVKVVGQLLPFLVGEPLPDAGHVRIPDKPGFGFALNRELEVDRPYVH